MTNIVIDLSKNYRVKIRPVADQEKFADTPRPQDGVSYWARSPHGNILYAVGVDQLAGLLSMLGAMELTLNDALRSLICNILAYEVDGFTIEIAFDTDIRGAKVTTPAGKKLPPLSIPSLILDQIADVTPNRQVPGYGRG